MSDKAILGLAQVTGMPFENKNDPRFSWAVELKFIKRTNPVTLAEMKSEPICKDFLLIKNPRLSTMLVPEPIAEWLLALA